MAEYISAEVLEKFIHDFHGNMPGLFKSELLWAIDKLPRADVVERKTGKWLFWQDDPDANVYECSACHEPLTLNEGTPRENNFNFCPFCGLPMIGGDDDV